MSFPVKHPVETNSNKELIECFENELSLEKQSKNWFKSLNTILHKCLKKVRICENKKKSENSTQKSQVIKILEKFDVLHYPKIATLGVDNKSQ